MQVTWYHVGADGAEPEEVLQTSRVSRLVAGQRHSLLVRNVRPQDLGTFLCSASNTLGEANATATLSGLQEPLSVKSLDSLTVPFTQHLSFVYNILFYLYLHRCSKCASNKKRFKHGNSK